MLVSSSTYAGISSPWDKIFERRMVPIPDSLSPGKSLASQRQRRLPREVTPPSIHLPVAKFQQEAADLLIQPAHLPAAACLAVPATPDYQGSPVPPSACHLLKGQRHLFSLWPALTGLEVCQKTVSEELPATLQSPVPPLSPSMWLPPYLDE